MKYKRTVFDCVVAFFSSVFLAFGMYNIHAISGITEGGMLGVVLLLQVWWHVSPALSNLLLNAFCYLLGWKTFGTKFLLFSGMSTLGYSIAYAICEQFPPLFPQIADHPLLAALIGCIFVGYGCGLCVRIGGAPGADDALAMSLSEITSIPIQWIYLLFDLIVLGLSLTYIPITRIGYSLLTVILSGQIIGFLQKKETKDT